MIFKRAMAAFFFVCLLSASASFAQTALTVRNALLVLSEVRPAISEAVQIGAAGEKSETPGDGAIRQGPDDKKGEQCAPGRPQARP